LVARPTLEYLVVDLHSSSGGLEILKTIRCARPSLKLIVIGPEGNDELVMDSIMAGAGACLEWTAGPETVRLAVEVVTGGSIWAPRRLLCKLIERLLKVPDSSFTNVKLHLTDRERQILELILEARSNREIARQLGIEETTVKTHLGRLMRKAGADNRIELSMRVMKSPQVSGTFFIERRRGEHRQDMASHYPQQPVADQRQPWLLKTTLLSTLLSCTQFP
jgi:DNA-binding NarL/FixJ family response regulator